jgi:hypothetical protein
MSGARSPVRIGLAAVCLLLASAGAGSGEQAAAGGPIGAVALVQGAALAVVPGQAERQLRFKDPVVEGLHVRLTGRDSLLKVAFFRTAPDGIGTYSLSGPSDAVIRRGANGANAEAPGGVVSAVLLVLGRLRLALLPGRGEAAEVQTPDAVVGIKGTYARLLVDPAIGTFVAVDEGIATVQARAGGRAVLVKGGQWVLVPPGGLPTRPTSAPSLGLDGRILEDPPLLGCCAQIEPPKPRGR